MYFILDGEQKEISDAEAQAALEEAYNSIRWFTTVLSLIIYGKSASEDGVSINIDTSLMPYFDGKELEFVAEDSGSSGNMIKLSMTVREKNRESVSEKESD